MTKGQYIDFIRNSLRRLDQTAKYHPNQVAIAIQHAFNTVFYEMYAVNPKSLDVYAKQIINATIAQDIATDRWYTTLSKSYVNLPCKSSGILTINTVTGTTLLFVPMNDMEMAQITDLDASLPANVIGYSVQPGRIEYYNMDVITAGLELRILYIQEFNDYALSDEVIPPHGQDQKIMTLVRDFLAGIPPVDTINDNADSNG
jgi:hypothetical protein